LLHLLNAKILLRQVGACFIVIDIIMIVFSFRRYTISMQKYNGVIMTLSGFLILLLVAGVCGALAQAIVGYSHGGCLVSIALGFIGAVLGVWLAGLLGLPEMFVIQIGGKNFPVIWTIIGAALFVALLNLITAARRRPPM
jgi:uncharacterized membrane protein YeaQ/YmgE (transglycosylase-associated protein family)